MKTIRYFVALLLLLTGVLHTLYIFRVQQDDIGTQMLAFGVIYFTLGVLLMVNRNFSPAWGIIFPMIGLVVAIFGFQHWTTLLIILLAIDAIIVFCSIFLFHKQ
jgi:uncharacterized membrane protein HdeD (DUF308 family)